MTQAFALVVDDHSTNRELLAYLLSLCGHEVATARDAKDALAAIARRRPDVILMDVQLPDMDGLELTQRLKADPATAGIGVIAVTAYAMPGDRDRALAAGCDDYVSKPIDTRRFPGIVESVLNRKQRA